MAKKAKISRRDLQELLTDAWRDGWCCAMEAIAIEAEEMHSRNSLALAKLEEWFEDVDWEGVYR